MAAAMDAGWSWIGLGSFREGPASPQGQTKLQAFIKPRAINRSPAKVLQWCAAKRQIRVASNGRRSLLTARAEMPGGRLKLSTALHGSLLAGFWHLSEAFEMKTIRKGLIFRRLGGWLAVLLCVRTGGGIAGASCPPPPPAAPNRPPKAQSPAARSLLEIVLERKREKPRVSLLLRSNQSYMAVTWLHPGRSVPLTRQPRRKRLASQ